MRFTSVAFVGLASLAMVSCSGSMGMEESDVGTYQQLVLDVRSTVTSYGGSMMGSGAMTTSSCQEMHSRYDGDVRPRVEQMMRMSGGMDELMDARGGSMYSDMHCSSQDMMDELDRHHLAACTSSDPSVDRAEAARHVDAMISYANHMQARTNEILGALDRGTSAWGPMMTGCPSHAHGGMMMLGD